MEHDYPDIPRYIRVLFDRLRRRRFPLGIEDYQALQKALRAGFGWSSSQALCTLCCALWAKSPQEQDTVKALFRELTYEFDLDWQITRHTSGFAGQSEEGTGTPVYGGADRKVRSSQRAFGDTDTVIEAYQGLPQIQWSGVTFPERAFTFVPQFPVTFREVVQAWRRLRRPVREGPKTELDLDATVARRSRTGVATSVVLVPPRRNRSRLMLLVDREGSMTPFQYFVDEVCAAIQQAGRLEQVARYYFHDVPAEGADEGVLAPLGRALFPALDSILPDIEPLGEGTVYADESMFEPVPLAEVLDTHADGADVAIISDGGAACGRYDLLRLLDTVAFLKALRGATNRMVWLNPLPERYWPNTTAAQIARHAPMCPLTREGLHQAVNVLHGKPYPVERPI